MASRNALGMLIGFLLLSGAMGCAPATFVQAAAGWKTLELREDLAYDQCWMTTVDLLTRDWDIDLMDKSSGYIRTNWHHGISGGPANQYRGRITVKFPDTKKPATLELKTEAQWYANGVWISGYDTSMQRDVYSAIGGKLTRSVPKDNP